MRIGLVSPYSLSVPGGVQGQVLALARALRKQGHDARVLGPCDGPPPDAGVTPLGRSIPLAANGSVAPIAPDVSCALRTIRALRDEAFDVVHVHEPLVPGPCMVSVFMKSAPMVGTFHAAGVSAAYRWGRPLLRMVADRIDLRCVVSDDARQLAQGFLRGTYEQVFNGIEVDEFAKATPWPTEAPTIAFCSRHEERKGLRVLVDALPLLPEDLRVWVMSDGPQTAELQAKTDGDRRVEWLGRVTDDERNRRLRGADVYAAPSLGGESFGVILLEAMAAGTPIVASDIPAYAAVARDNREALLVPPGDAPALARAITRVLADADCARRLGEAGSARADSLSMDHLAERYLGLYATIVR